MSVEERILIIESKIAATIKRSGRKTNSVTLVGVSKRQPIDRVNEYLVFQTSRNQNAVLGENYVQEYKEKLSNLNGQHSSHLIGPLQRNKVKLAVSLFDLIETVGSEKLLAEIDNEAAKIKKVQNVYLQVNISKDKAKAGFLPDALTPELASKLASYSSIKIQGLMTITQLYEEAEEARKDYSSLRELGKLLEPSLSLTQCSLSMGMSDDFEVAIEEGATHVRIGSALFGERKQSTFVPFESVLE